MKINRMFSKHHTNKQLFSYSQIYTLHMLWCVINVSLSFWMYGYKVYPALEKSGKVFKFLRNSEFTLPLIMLYQTFHASAVANSIK